MKERKSGDKERERGGIEGKKQQLGPGALNKL